MKLKALRFWRRRIIKRLIGYSIPWPDEGWNLVEVTKILLLIILNFGKKEWKTSRVGSEFSFAANMFYQLNSAHRIVYDNGVDLINSGTLDTKPRKWVEFEITIKKSGVWAYIKFYQKPDVFGDERQVVQFIREKLNETLSPI